MMESVQPPAPEPQQGRVPGVASAVAPVVAVADDAGSAGQAIGGRYLSLELLGRGGMGVVYRVEDRRTGQQLALKQLQLQALSERSAQHASALFEREYYTLAQLAHPRVVEVYDYGIDAAGAFYTMELLDGGDLKEIAPLEVPRACQLMLDVCSSLALLHSRRLVHRDVSPRNIRWTRDGHAKLIDFGAMVPVGPCSHTVGTPAFVAPEVLHHSLLDGRTDLFSLGASLYYALTGRVPFAVQHFAELRQAWAREPVPPSRLVAGIPPALDALCAALLRIDPAQRPASVFEVMKRLTAIGGIERHEALTVSRAYLTTPVLTGREPQLRRFRRAMRQAIPGVGSCLRFEGAAGMGRSRMLDACALEAKTLGATVLRAAPAGGEATPFASAQQLVAQLLDALPTEAPAAAERAGVSALLWPNGGGPGQGTGAEPPQLGDIAQRGLERATLQAGLSSFFVEAARQHTIVLIVDDIEAVDEPSVALLAELAIAAPRRRILIAHAQAKGARRLSASHDALAEHSKAIALPALSAPAIGSLLVSVFGDVPHIALLSDRLYKVALGSPGDTLVLAQHLVDSGTIRYDDGQWTLPSRLTHAQLPDDATGVLEARIAALPRVARALLETQALLGAGALRREDYRALVPDASAADLEQAIAELLAQQLIDSDGEYHRLCHGSLGEVLCAGLTPQQLRERHLALHEFHAARGAHAYVTVPHLLAAERVAQALDELASDGDLLDRKDGMAALIRLDLPHTVAALERCLELSIADGRPRRETQEIRRRLVAMSAVDESLHRRYGPVWLRQLELDSGLSDYRALDPAMDPAARLQAALTSTMGRYAETPERDRVYPLDQALKHLGSYCVLSIMVASRTADGELLEPLPGLLEPFAGLSPALHALWQNSLATHEEMNLGRARSAAQRWQEVYDRLGQPDCETITYAEQIRFAVAAALGVSEVQQGLARAVRWADVLENNPNQRVLSVHLRRLACLNRGDVSGAARFEREAEIRALQSSTAELFNRPFTADLALALRAKDLEGVKRALDGMAELALRHPAWARQRDLAEGAMQELRGDLPAAQRAFERCLETCVHGDGRLRTPRLWCAARTGLVGVHAGLGRYEEAVALGEETLRRCEEAGLEDGLHGLACVTALAEARLGRVGRAAERVDGVLAEQEALGIDGLSLARSYEARARIAVHAGDAEQARRFIDLALRRGGRSAGAASASLADLLDDAREAGIEVAISPSEFEVSVLGTGVTQEGEGGVVISERVRQALSGCGDPSSRARASLALLCEITAAPAGHLYLVGPDGALEVVASRRADGPDADALAFARGFFAQQIDDAEMTAALTEATRMEALPGTASYVDPRGHEHRLFMLNCKHEGQLCALGLAVLAPAAEPVEALEFLVEGPALAAALLEAGDTSGRQMEAPA